MNLDEAIHNLNWSLLENPDYYEYKILPATLINPKEIIIRCRDCNAFPLDGDEHTPDCRVRVEERPSW